MNLKIMDGQLFFMYQIKETGSFYYNAFIK